IMGILKAGGAYLPVEPEYPQDRINYMLKDSCAGHLVTLYGFKEKIDFHNEPIYLDNLDLDNSDEAASLDESNDLGEIRERQEINTTETRQTTGQSASSLAYIIYTSGTTGRPKGVAVEHRNLVNYTSWRLDTYALSPRDVTLQLLSYAFDGFCSNYYSSLISGAVLLLVPDSKKMDFTYIVEDMVKRAVTNLSLVPGMYEALLNSSENEEFKNLRFVVLAGEKAGKHLIEKSKENNPHLRHIIEYGPTETTVTAAAQIDMELSDTGIIGTPIANTKIYIVDQQMKPQPIGIPGELCISGRGITRGYINRQELTADKFRKADSRGLNTQSKQNRGKDSQKKQPPITNNTLFRTGDLARWLSKGKLEFMGRIDRQVKIRGYRIELGELESHLLAVESIREAVIIDRENKKGEKYLCAYLVSPQPLNTGALRETLLKSVPEYMLPSYFVPIDEVPLTLNGKLDRKALPEPDVTALERQYAEPRTHKEIRLAEIWQEILETGKIGIDDDFFAHGGDSIKAIQIISRLKKYK
ncbi:MAG: amino acid adenylation domain-containing protein, partial [bacterium]|nr:amino acid adenylation domain-containing protein [bacterium]